MNKLLLFCILLLPYVLQAQQNFIDVFVQPRKQTKLFFKSNVKSFTWDDPKFQKLYNALPGDRELAFFHIAGDTLPAFIQVELVNKEKYTFLVVYTTNTAIEIEYNLEDSKARGEVMLDQKERRAAGIPDLSFLEQPTTKDKSEDKVDKVEKKEEPQKITKEKEMGMAIPEKPTQKISSMEKKREKVESKKKEKIKKEVDEPDRNVEMEEYINANQKKKTKEVKQEKLTVEDKSDKKTKPNKKSSEESADYSIAIELLNYLDLQEDGDLAEIQLIDPIELANGYKMKRNQTIKIPIEIQQGRIYITLLNQLVLSYRGTVGFPLTLNKNNIDARFIKK